jgi:hypothetical protein
VAGAPVGTGTVAVGVGAAVAVADGDAVGDAVGDAEGLADGLAEALGLALGPRAVPLKNPVGEAAAPAEEEGVVQAETATEANRAATTQPIAVDLALSADRALMPTVMEPPHATARWRPASWSPESVAGHKSNAHRRQWPVYHSDIRLRGRRPLGKTEGGRRHWRTRSGGA